MPKPSRHIHRRSFLGTVSASVFLSSWGDGSLAGQGEGGFEISLNESSLDRALTEKSMDHLELARITRQEFGITGVEYVSRYFKKGFTDEYLTEMNRRAADHEVFQLLIVVDDEGRIGDPDRTRRDHALENHRHWIRVAKTLGCHSIQVDPTGTGQADEQLKRTAEALTTLAEFAAALNINVLAGQCGGHSRHAPWLVDLIKRVDRENCRVMPRFAGFGTSDRYEGMKQLTPLAKAICASSFDFDDQGNEVNTDFQRMMKLIVASGYRGYVGIEYAGKRLDERAGVRKTAELLTRIRDTLS